MKKIWGYISAILSGIILGLIIGAKWLAGQDVSIEIRKIKNKRVSGDATTSVPIDLDMPEKKGWFQRRRDRKNK